MRRMICVFVGRICWKVRFFIYHHMSSSISKCTYLCYPVASRCFRRVFSLCLCIVKYLSVVCICRSRTFKAKSVNVGKHIFE